MVASTHSALGKTARTTRYETSEGPDQVLKLAGGETSTCIPRSCSRRYLVGSGLWLMRRSNSRWHQLFLSILHPNSAKKAAGSSLLPHHASRTTSTCKQNARSRHTTNPTGHNELQAPMRKPSKCGKAGCRLLKHTSMCESLERKRYLEIRRGGRGGAKIAVVGGCAASVTLSATLLFHTPSSALFLATN